MSCGIDIGTGFLVSARQDDNAQIQIKSIRDCFLDMDNDPSIKSMLKMSKMDYIESEDKIYIIGGSASTLASMFKKEVRRPLSKGVISPGELEAEKILLILIENILGKATVPGEICYYSVPGDPIDRDIDVVYHRAMFSKLLSSLNYKPVAMNESAAISYSNAAKENFSSLSISLGAGMTNICLMFETVPVMTFSLSRGGDNLDTSAAKATGSTANKVQSIKEKGLNLLDPSEGDPKTFREREALIIYYKSLILYAFDSIKKEFEKRGGTVELPYAIPLILSGGSSLPKNFIELFKAAYDSVRGNFAIPISEIRMANSPLNAVAQGLLIAALNHDAKDS